ncbi:histidine triad (HIT) family protein [Chitinophaga costaii]|uniref:Histidine triad (HIT) family protein n=1 Tax=Chitinophaga costaii TaxID=1335309 RepID=A0A1C4F3D4_9BACT|nr:HIT domain-containing protein [Chitinophaga costaii]PUZ22087.1 HIT domain-containing protein [Chitinophaga costaii]SCC50549.1 histidine triad (HIT) family protein [Chitinophaga costaii]
MTIFTKIINGDIPSYRIAENDKFYAFLDIAPLAEGHTLVVPKVEVDKFFEIPDVYLAEFLLFAKKVSEALERSFECNRIGVTVIGLEVPHAHMHLIPINGVDDMNFSRPKLKLSPEQFKGIQEKILANFEER